LGCELRSQPNPVIGVCCNVVSYQTSGTSQGQITEQEEQQLSDQFALNLDVIDWLKKQRPADSRGEELLQASIAQLEEECCEIIQKIVEAHPELYTIWPDGSFSLTEGLSPVN
jgi:hypothetical protein